MEHTKEGEKLMDHTKEGMQIEEGKYYLLANGKKAGPAKGINSPSGIKWNVPNSEGDLLGYYDDGRVCVTDLEDEYNLIAEWAEEPQTDTPKVWGEMTDEEKGALLLEWHEGRAREFYNAGEWEIDEEEAIDPNLAYRVRPEPKRQMVTLYGYRGVLGGQWCMQEEITLSCCTHRITFDTIDGKPDCNSINMEEIND